MRKAIRIDQVFGVPMAVKGPDGEWKEVGYVSDLIFAVEQDEWRPWEPVFGTPQRYTMDVDLESTPEAYQILLDIMQAQSVVDGNGE